MAIISDSPELAPKQPIFRILNVLQSRLISTDNDIGAVFHENWIGMVDVSA